MKKRLKWLIPLAAVAIVASVATTILILLLTNPIVHESEHVSVKSVPSAEKTTQIYAQMSALTEDMVLQYPLVVTGVVKNIREVEVTFTDFGRESTTYVTLFDFQVTDYIKNNSSTLKEKNVLTLGHSLSSYRWVAGTPSLTEGNEYLLFCYVFADDSEPEPLYTHEYTDAWITDPVRLIIPKDGDVYVANEFFKPYTIDTPFPETESNSMMTFRAPAEAFENFIREYTNDIQEGN